VLEIQSSVVLPAYLKVSPSLTLKSEEIRFTQHGSRFKDTPFSYMHIRKQKRAARLFTQRPKNLNKLASEKLGTLALAERSQYHMLNKKGRKV
jgi:hypothetical protein